MSRVALILTGQLELAGLAPMFERMFPGHAFDPVDDKPAEPFASFTSYRLPAPRLDAVPTNLDKLVEQLASEVCPGRGDHPADLAVLIDDLELCNADQPQTVTDAVREAVRAHLRKLERRLPRRSVELVARALRERASFHLAVPMIESWLFANAAVLPTAGVPPDRLPARLRAGIDPEQFATDDPEYAADDGSHCDELHRLARRRRQKRRHKCAPGPAWLIDRRIAHPKAYLQWLCRDPSHRRCTAYRESLGGAEALQALDWDKVLGSPEHCRFARALIADLADALGETLPTQWTGDEAPFTSRFQAPSESVLRNL